MGWHQFGQTVTYEPSIYTETINELNPKSTRQYMQLSFEYSFVQKNDEVFCAYTIPYTYSTLMSHIQHLKALASKSGKQLNLIQ